MRIGIDGYNLAMRHGTGIATYGLVLANVLRMAGQATHGIFGIDVGRDPAMREVLFFDRLGRETAPPRTKREAKRRSRQMLRAAAYPFAMGLREVPLTDRIERSSLDERFPRFDQLASSGNLFEISARHFKIYGSFLQIYMANPPDIMHWTYPIPIKIRGIPNIYTIHDIVPLRLPFTTLDEKVYYRQLLKSCIRNSAQICTVSETSRADIVREFDILPDRITNTYQSSPLPVALLDQSPSEDAAIIEGIFGLKSQKYFLYFGAIEPKKNIGRLIEAYLGIQIETPLVLVGSRSWQADEELKLLRRVDNSEADTGFSDRRIIQLDHLSRAMLLRLVRGARAVLFPSLYEGFGLPVLEAMQLGTPVLTSGISALPEVSGNAAVYVDPYEVRDIAAALMLLDKDEDLRQRLARSGPIEAERFSVPAYQSRLQGLYSAAGAAASIY